MGPRRQRCEPSRLSVLGGKYRDRVRIYADCHAGKGLASLSPVLLPRTPSWMRRQGKQKGRERKAELSPKYHGGQKSEAKEIRPRDYARRALGDEAPRLYRAEV